MVAECEAIDNTNEQEDKDALITLVEAKKGVEEVLKERTAGYEKEWQLKGRIPAPDKNEWQEMEEVETEGRPQLQNGLWMYGTWGVRYYPRRVSSVWGLTRD
jgi:hypothetical protein